MSWATTASTHSTPTNGQRRRRRQVPIRQPQPHLERTILRHYERQLKDLRLQSSRWYLRPQIWLVRLNRNVLARGLGAERRSDDVLNLRDDELRMAMEEYYRDQLSDYRRGGFHGTLSPRRGWRRSTGIP
ncbi:MAG: hypothetical protein WDO13_14575 [Verrucomicrobiota bacterium]